MMVLSTLIDAIANILHMVIILYIWILIASALISWVNPNPFNPIVQVLTRLSAPAYYLIRKLRIPTIVGGIDLAPIILIFALQFLDLFLIRLLHEIARSL